MSVYLNEEQKKVFESFNDLLPWDRGNLLYALALNSDRGEIEKYFLDELGYIKYDDYDAVKDVIDNGLETDVLNEMGDTEICDYLLSAYDPEENVKYMIDSLYSDDVAELVSELSDDTVIKAIDIIKKNYPDTYKKILLHIGGVNE